MSMRQFLANLRSFLNEPCVTRRKYDLMRRAKVNHLHRVRTAKILELSNARAAQRAETERQRRVLDKLVGVHCERDRKMNEMFLTTTIDGRMIQQMSTPLMTDRDLEMIADWIGDRVRREIIHTRFVMLQKPNTIYRENPWVVPMSEFPQ